MNILGIIKKIILNDELLELQKVCERLYINRENWGEKNKLLIRKIFNKIERKGIDNLNRKEKVCLSEYFEISYYNGKLMAYTWVISFLSRGTLKINEQKFPNLFKWVKEYNNNIQKSTSCEHLKKASWNEGDNNLTKTYE